MERSKATIRWGKLTFYTLILCFFVFIIALRFLDSDLEEEGEWAFQLLMFKVLPVPLVVALLFSIMFFYHRKKDADDYKMNPPRGGEYTWLDRAVAEKEWEERGIAWDTRCPLCGEIISGKKEAFCPHCGKRVAWKRKR